MYVPSYFKKLVVVRRFLQKVFGFYLVAENGEKRGCIMFQKLLLVISEIVVFVQYYVQERIRFAAGGKPVKRIGVDVIG